MASVKMGESADYTRFASRHPYAATHLTRLSWAASCTARQSSPPSMSAASIRLNSEAIQKPRTPNGSDPRKASYQPPNNPTPQKQTICTNIGKKVIL